MTLIFGCLVTAIGGWLAVKAQRGSAPTAHRLAGALIVVFLLWGFSFAADVHAIFYPDNCDQAWWSWWFWGC